MNPKQTLWIDENSMPPKNYLWKKDGKILENKDGEWKEAEEYKPKETVTIGAEEYNIADLNKINNVIKFFMTNYHDTYQYNDNSYATINDAYANLSFNTGEETLAEYNVTVYDAFGFKYNGHYDFTNVDTVDKDLYRFEFGANDSLIVYKWNHTNETWDEVFGENSTPIESWNFGITYEPTGNYVTEVDFWGNEYQTPEYRSVEIKQPSAICIKNMFDSGTDRRVYQLYVNDDRFYIISGLSMSSDSRTYSGASSTNQRYL